MTFQGSVSGIEHLGVRHLRRADRGSPRAVVRDRGEEAVSKLRFSGIVRLGETDVWIGDRAVIDEIEDVNWQAAYGSRFPLVSVCLMDERFDGLLHAICGSPGYSEYTPAEPGQLKVGDHDVFKRLRELNGRNVTLIVADEPANSLEEWPEPAKVQVKLLEIVARGGVQSALNECVSPKTVLDLLAVVRSAERYVMADNHTATLPEDYQRLREALDNLDFSAP